MLKLKICIMLIVSVMSTIAMNAQTMVDGVFMPKKVFCGGLLYTNDAWKNYWEGTSKRDNQNIGTVTTQSVALMFDHGITNRLNLLGSLPYVTTKASLGTLAGQRGIQDLNLALKYKLYDHSFGKLQIIGAMTLGASTPIGNYTPDLLPLSIGMQSKTAFGTAIVYAQHKNGLTATINATYTARGNVKLDRYSYYTTQQNQTNIAAVPDVTQYNVKFGYCTYRLEVIANYLQTTCRTGNDIRVQDAPFVGNKMDMSRVGLFTSYRIKPLKDLQIVAMYWKTIKGRNVGESQTFSVGLMKTLDFNKKEKATK